MNLYLEPPAFGLPSSDAECIAALGYCALVAPESFTVDYSAASSALVTDYLPSLHDTSADLWLSGFEEIVLHLRRLGLDADDTLDTQAKAESTAYASLIHNAAPDLTVSLTSHVFPSLQRTSAEALSSRYTSMEMKKIT